MAESIRTAVYDRELDLEAYRLQGTVQAFPCHFHDYYVLGLMESGTRLLQWGGDLQAAGPGSILVFQPGAPHGCVQSGGSPLDYRSLNIRRDVMLALAEEAAGQRALPGFSQAVIEDREISRCLRRLHDLVMGGARGPEKREALLPLLSRLIGRYGEPLWDREPARGAETARARALMEARCGERLTLAEIGRQVGMSKSTLLRAFVREAGVTPYRWLENIRVGRARALLREGATPAEAALRTGFVDQSHLTNTFGRFIGLSPGAYRDIFWEGDGRKHGGTS